MSKLNICNVKDLIKLLQFSYSYEEKLIIIAIDIASEAFKRLIILRLLCVLIKSRSFFL